MKMMTEDDIRTELGWTDSMIYSLLQNPDSTNARRDKFTGGYTYGLYHRDGVLAVAQSTEGEAAKRRWDETRRGDRPNPEWTTRLDEIGPPPGVAAIAAGKSWSYSDIAPKSMSPMPRFQLDVAFDGGMVSLCTMTGTWSVRSPPSDRQLKSPANRQSLMRSPQPLLKRTGERG
jgi:hypothetical protein